MGYTHYFYRHEITHDEDTWNKFLEDIQKVASKFKLRGANSLDFITENKILKGTGEIDIEIGDGMGDGNPPEFGKERIWFNGVDEEAHETLGIERDFTAHLNGRMSNYYKNQWEEDKKLFECTKTARKPYDLLVTATLALYKHHFKDKVTIGSDGNRVGFEDGVKLVNDTLGYSIKTFDLFPDNEED